jgi:hypothetical protein
LKVLVAIILTSMLAGCQVLPGTDNSGTDSQNPPSDAVDTGDLAWPEDTFDRDSEDGFVNHDGLVWDPGIPVDNGQPYDVVDDLPFDHHEPIDTTPTDLSGNDTADTEPEDIGTDPDTAADSISDTTEIETVTPECATASDCLIKTWDVYCDGHWVCEADGTCRAECGDPCGDGACKPEDGENDMNCLPDCLPECGDGHCNAAGGEDPSTCQHDCWIDTCTLQMGPTCIASDCQQEDHRAGKCKGDVDGCTCQAKYGSCVTDHDCLEFTWPIRCAGQWNCINEQCQPECGGPCGDTVCDISTGEDSTTCSADCPVRDAHCDDGTDPICDRMPPVCTEFEIFAYQENCYVCVNAATCKQWGEAGCSKDPDCKITEWCSPCGTSSCPLCDNCLPACAAHGCPTEELALCNTVRPDCGEGNIAIIRDGCWVCVDMVTCVPY